MAEIRPPYRHDLDTLVKKTYLNGIFATGDALANCFAVELYKGSVSYTIPSSARVMGYFVRKGMDTVELPGTKSGNVASVTLSSACYNQNGPFTLTIKVLEGGAVTTVFYGEGSVAISRTGYTVNPSFEAAEYYQYPVNLLDNSNFANPVAQAGFSAYDSTNAVWTAGLHGTVPYAADRWATNAVTAKCTNTYTRLTALSRTARVHQVMQYMAGKTVTIAAKIRATSIAYVGIYYYQGDVQSSISASKPSGFNGITIVSGTIPSDATNIRCCIYPGYEDNGGYTDVYWAAVYEGEYTADTLPMYIPKPYAVELAECQRYYVPGVGSVWGMLHVDGNGYAMLPIDTPVTMRANPSIVPNGTTVYAGGTWLDLDVTKGNVQKHAGVVYISFSPTAISSMGLSDKLVAGKSYITRNNPALSCDLEG